MDVQRDEITCQKSNYESIRLNSDDYRLRSWLDFKAYRLLFVKMKLSALSEYSAARICNRCSEDVRN